MVPGGRLNRRMTRRLSTPRKRRGWPAKATQGIGTTIKITNGSNNIDIYGQGCFLIFCADIDGFFSTSQTDVTLMADRPCLTLQNNGCGLVFIQLIPIDAQKRFNRPRTFTLPKGPGIGMADTAETNVPVSG